MVKRTITITTIVLILAIAVGLIVMLNKSSYALNGSDDFYVPPSELPGNGSTVVDSDVQETCTWRLYTDGTMVISPTNGVSGNLGNIGINSDPTNFHEGLYPSWRRIKDSVNYIVIDEGVSAGIALGGAFAEMPSLEYVNLRNLDTSNCTASMVYLFKNDTNLKKIDFGSNFTTSQILGGLDKQSGARRYIDWMFQNCTSLEELDLSIFDVSHFLRYPYSSLSSCSSLRKITLGDNWNFTNQSDFFPSPPSTGGYSGKWVREDGTGQAYTPAEIATEYISNPSSMVGTWVWEFSPVAVFSEDQTLYMVRPSKIYDLTNNVGRVLSINGNEYTGQVFTIDEMNTQGARTWASVKSQVKKVVVIDEISPRNTSSWFEGFSSCTEMDLENLDTSESTSMYAMFKNCSEITSIDVSGFDTSNVTYMESMFYRCYKLASLDVSGFNTSKVSGMKSMFSDCNVLTTLDVSGFDTSKVTDMSGMFFGCKMLTSLDVSGFDTSRVTDMGWMFSSCNELTLLDVSGFNTEKVKIMSYMFSDCNELTSLDVSGFDTSEVTKMIGMFRHCENLTTLDVSEFNTSKVTDMYDMFAYCSELTSIEISGIDTSNVIDMGSMFLGCKSLTTLDVSGFNTSKVTDMREMFYGCKALTTLDVSGFNTSNVTNMGQMFGYCTSLSFIDVSGFDTSNAINMELMFAYCTSLSFIDVSGFDTSKVTNMSNMFAGCRMLTSLDVSGFNTSNVTNMNSMFYYCDDLTYLDLSNFNTNSVINMNIMFRGLDNLDMITLGEDFSFDGQGNISYKALLPTPTGERFTGKWIREDGAYGPYTPTELRDNYDGATMAGNWIRERKPLTVTYRYTGTVPQGASELPETRIYEVGENVTVEPDATAP